MDKRKIRLTIVPAWNPKHWGKFYIKIRLSHGAIRWARVKMLNQWKTDKAEVEPVNFRLAVVAIRAMFRDHADEYNCLGHRWSWVNV